MAEHDGILEKILVRILWFLLIWGLLMIAYAWVFVAYIPWTLYWALILVGCFCASFPVYLHINRFICLWRHYDRG